MDSAAPTSAAPRVAYSVRIEGTVQGVGFRPYVYRLATELGLTGEVANTPNGVLIQIEGPVRQAELFLDRLPREKPPLASIDVLETELAAPRNAGVFEIRGSQVDGAPTASILPDIATCPDCLREIFDSSDRRHRYPFTNCTHCGPRFSIIESLPYDRSRTTMKRFRMCAECEAEYLDPSNRRFHAQPNACPECGPQAALWDARGRAIAKHYEAIESAAQAIRQGRVLAVKGLGGFHLVADAQNAGAVSALRQRKHREAKPLAIMAPDLAWARKHCAVPDTEAGLLTSPRAPITLLAKRHDGGVTEDVAPGNPFLGVMLPYTPLHHLLMAELRIPIVATSGNLSDEPICIDAQEALSRLSGIADAFLVHDRPIARPVDDSVVRVMAGDPMLLRRARGYAPSPIALPVDGPDLLALGGHLKNTVAVARSNRAYLSQHVGDLDTAESVAVFERAARDLPRLYEVRPACIVHDAHPDYYSTAYAMKHAEQRIAVQHHYAHAAACMAEHHLSGPALAVTWDGAGYGGDGTIWGGEFLRVEDGAYARVAHLRPFALPGGDAAAKEPRRSAAALLHELRNSEDGDELSWPDALTAAFTPEERRVLTHMLERGLNTIPTTSAGRLFDAMSALLGIQQRSRFEGQAAMMLEYAAGAGRGGPDLSMPLRRDKETWVVDWGPAVVGALQALHDGAAAEALAAAFHRACAQAIAGVASAVGETAVVLTGGCFQNKLLLEEVIERLKASGHTVYWPRWIPPNDGGIALGQLAAARWHMARTEVT